jgi:hypothetical protein
LTCTGCVSTSPVDPLTIVNQENNSSNQPSTKRLVNQQLLSSIQALRTSKKVIDTNRTFTYELNTTELNYRDKISITEMITSNNTSITINIAPAKGTNKLFQLTLSMERAEILRLYINHFSNQVKINFAPKLANDNINLIVGA